jgi:hypothetical protein
MGNPLEKERKLELEDFFVVEFYFGVTFLMQLNNNF